MTDWNKAVYTDDESTPAPHDIHGNTENILGKALTAGVKTVVNGVTMAPQMAWHVGQTLGKDVSPVLEGHMPDIPGTELYNQDTSARNDLHQQASDAFAKGDTKLGIAHSIASYLPILGPTAEGIVKDLYKGAKEGDTDAWGRGMGGISSFAVGPESFGAAKGPVSDMLHDSAVKNYEGVLQKPRTPAPANTQPLITRTAENLASGPKPTAASLPGFIAKMNAGAKMTAADIDPAVSFDQTGLTADVRDLIGHVDKFADNRYYAKAPDGSLRPVNKTGISLVDDLKSELVNHTAAVLRNQNPGMVTAGQAAQMQNVPWGIDPKISQEAINKISSNLTKGTVDRTGKFTDVDPKSVARLDRDHAQVLKDYLYSANPNLAGINSLYGIFKSAGKLAQEQLNREGSRPSSIPGLSEIAKKKIPHPIQNSIANVAWNTVAGSTKAKLAEALASDNWPVATRILQFAKLGVPAGDDNEQ